MNIKHLFFCMLLIAFSSCSKPGYEKAIAEWVQTDSHGTWTDLKFELLEVLETEDVTVSVPGGVGPDMHVIGLRSQLTALVGHIRWQRET